MSLSLGEECNLMSEFREQGSDDNIWAQEQIVVKYK